MKVIFMGTPDFAAPTLQSLIATKHEIIAVYTKEPKPAGRGYAEVKSIIHQIAESANLPVYTPRNFKNPTDIDTFKKLNADIAVVAAYGLILPKAILDSPKYGCINIHPSKLPRWRGAAPIQRTILSGDDETQVCIMQMDEGMDTGDIILSQDLPIPSSMTAKELHDETSKIGATLLPQTLDLIEAGKATRTKQSIDGVTHAAKLSRGDEKINWNDNAFKIHCQVRAFSPRPGAYFTYNNEIIKIITAGYENGNHAYKAGTVVDDKLTIACSEGFIKPTLLQREGKKMIYTEAFLRGMKIPAGSILLN